MTTPAKKREIVSVALSGGPAQAVAVIPNSARYRAFIILISGFDAGKDFEVQGSFDGTNYATLNPTAFSLADPHFTSSATPQMIQVHLKAPLPGGIRVVSRLSDLTTDGQVDVMMFQSAYSQGITEYS